MSNTIYIEFHKIFGNFSISRKTKAFVSTSTCQVSYEFRRNCQGMLLENSENFQH
jgi:hypothetical protein